MLLGIRGTRERVPVERQFPDHRVTKLLGALAPRGDIVLGPPLPELRVTGGELFDQIGEALVAGVARALHAQLRDGQTGDLFPVRVQLAHPGFGEQQPDEHALLLRVAPEIGPQGGGELVPGQDVGPPTDHERRSGGEVVQHAPQLGVHLLAIMWPGRAHRLSRRELEHVDALVLVEAEHLGDLVQQGTRRLETALLDPRVVLGADRGQ